MKKIEFGFANDMNPTGSWEGIGINSSTIITSGTYYGAVEYEGDSYVVSKLGVEGERYPHLSGKFLVRKALVDIFVDGSSILYLDLLEDELSSQIAADLNNIETDNIRTIQDVCAKINALRPAKNIFKLLEMDDSIVATSINHEVFTAKKEALKGINKPISILAQSYRENNNYSR